MPSLNAKNKPKNTAAESIAENNIYLEAVAPTNTPSSKKAATDTKGIATANGRYFTAVATVAPSSVSKERKPAPPAA